MGTMGWKSRLAAVASVLWILVVYGLSSGDSESATITLLVGVFPVALIWGIAWIIRGYLQQRRRTAPTSQPLQSDDPLALPLATRWPRFFARIFDVWWETLLVAVCLGWVLNRYSPSFVEWSNRPGSDALFGMMCLPLALILDSLIYGLCGNTPGKAFLGLKVMSFRGNRLGLSDYLNRNMALWPSGLGLGFPIVNLITMAWQSRRLGNGQPASYDEKRRSSVRARGAGWLPKTAFALCFAALLVVMFALQGIHDASRRAEPPLNAKAYKWENPVTGVAATIDPRWVYSAQKNEDGQEIHVFTERAQRAIVIFALEKAPGYTFTQYVNAFQTNTVAQMRFTDGGIFSTVSGRPSWQASGNMVEDESNRLNARVVQADGGFWRAVSTQAMPYGYSEATLAELQAALWNTVAAASH